MNKQLLDSMLDDWARFYLSEFNEVNWARVSMSGKIAEVAKLGIFSAGTAHNGECFFVPEHIESVVNGLMRLKLSYQRVIKEQYTGTGTQRTKAGRLNMNHTQFKVKLFRARNELIKLLS